MQIYNKKINCMESRRALRQALYLPLSSHVGTVDACGRAPDTNVGRVTSSTEADEWD